MNKRWFAVLFLGIAACNYDVGECYVRGDDGAGGSIIITPTGGGGYGAVPLEPQNAGGYTDPCSSQVAECTVTWTAGSDVCKQQGATGSCTTLYQGQHATLVEAQEQCAKYYGVGAGSGAQSCGACQWTTSSNNDCKEHCKKQCDKIHDLCHANCTKYDPTSKCRAKCNDQYASCLKDCDRNC